MIEEGQISTRLEDEPDIVYPDSDQDVPEINGFEMEPVYSEAQQALIAHFGDRDDVLVARQQLYLLQAEWLSAEDLVGLLRRFRGRP